MYAIVDIAGTQFKLQKGDRIKTPRLDLEVGQTTQLTKVLLWSKEKGVSVGRPFVRNAAVSARVLAHGRDKKVIVFKMKRRKGYRNKNGHRQGFTELLIEDFVRPAEGTEGEPEASVEAQVEEPALVEAEPAEDTTQAPAETRTPPPSEAEDAGEAEASPEAHETGDQ